MEIRQEIDDRKLTFYLEDERERLGEIHSIFAGKDKVIIEHTEVAEKHEGKGLGKKLIQAVIDYVQEHDLKLIPLCPYANAFFKKNYDTYKDLLWSIN